MTPSRLRIGVLGASGFTGKECLRLLGRHPAAELAFTMSARSSEQRASHQGALCEPRALPPDLTRVPGTDAVLLCAPPRVAAELTPELLERTRCVIDLSAGHRLRDVSLYESHYGFAHPNPGLLDGAVYGLTEWARESLRGARLVANPGCYATGVLLPMRALLSGGCLDPGSDIVADCKSGVSGAGKTLEATTHFASVHEDFRAYAVGRHRHEPEIRQELKSERIFFTPHLLPVFRGILATIHVRPAPGLRAADLRAVLREHYAAEPFVRILEKELPCLSEVQHTNVCAIGLADHGDRVVVVSCLDNLVKGAAGQALQNLNAVFGLPEESGLETGSLAPQGWR
ncbi:MAG: N-acetyl-gamma-glutamyl-phosphate reductase [Planctomycetota bacterium]